MATQQSEVWGWQAYFDELSTFLHQLERQEGRANQQFAEYAMERLGTTTVSVTNIRDILTSAMASVGDQERDILLHYQSSMNELLESLQSASLEWDRYLDSLQSLPDQSASYHASTSLTGRQGRPRFQICLEQLEYLSSMSFTWTDIASLLGVSRMTVYRRRVEYGMLRQGRELGVVRLNTILREMRVDFPDMGEVMVLGRLRALRYHVSRNQVRRGIRSTDPLNTALQGRIGPTHRRPYSVPGSNSLWHIGKAVV